MSISYPEMQLGVTREKRLRAVRASDTTVSNGGYLEQYVYIADAGSSGRNFVTYNAQWLIAPLHRKIDVFGIAVDNATVVAGTTNASYYYVIDRNYNGVYQPGWKSERVTLTNHNTYSKGIATKVQLMADTFDGIQKVMTQSMSLSYYVTRDNPNIKTIAVAGYYRHQEKTSQISPSISGIDISVGISLSSSSYFTNMTPNPYTVLY